MVCYLSLTPALLLRPYSSMLLEKTETEGVQDTTATHIVFKDVTETVVRAELKVGDHNDRVYLRLFDRRRIKLNLLKFPSGYNNGFTFWNKHVVASV